MNTAVEFHSMIEFHERDAIWKTLSPFREWISENFLQNLISALDRGIVLSVSVASNTSAKHMRWNGLLMVHFTDRATPKQMFDYIVSPSHADEISMEQDERTIRLWWD